MRSKGMLKRSKSTEIPTSRLDDDSLLSRYTDPNQSQNASIQTLQMAHPESKTVQIAYNPSTLSKLESFYKI